MKASVSLKMDNLDYALRALSNAQPELKKATAPVLKEIAQLLRSRARANVNVSHPRNFFRASGHNGARLRPSYRTKQMGEYWWVVQTPSTEAGAREAMAEFMARGMKPQGAALVRALNAVYGRSGGSGGGRILYKTRDEIDAEAAAMFEAAVAKAAADLQKEL